MGTTYRVQVVAAPGGATRASLRVEVEAILARIDRQFSTYRVDSEISRFNLSESTEWQPVSGAVVSVAAHAEQQSRLSEGAFDITAGPLLSLWGFGPGNHEPRVPSQSSIRRVRRQVGHRNLEYRRNPPALRKRSGNVQVDMNALVAGHAADLVAERLEQLGIQNYLVDMGGEFRLRGRSARGDEWNIAIEDPVPDSSRIRQVLSLTDCAVSTAGIYRNFFEAEGRRFPHVLDARTGWPVRHALASVTVIAPTALLADAWATTLLVLGDAEGFALAERERVAALFIAGRGGKFEEVATPAFRAYLAPDEAD